MQNFPSKISFLAAACLFGNVVPFYSTRASGLANSYSPVPVLASSTLPQPSRLYIEGSAGVNRTTTTQTREFLYGDAMLPLYGNSEGFGFLDVTGKWGTGNSGWLGSLGAGLREIWGDDIFGGYVFAEYDRTALGNYYWTLIPGLELISPRWDLHLNGYFPLSNKDNPTGVFFGSQLGVTCPTFIGHQQFDQVFNRSNEVANGMDFQIGYTFRNFGRIRIFGAGFYYGFEHATKLQGGAGGIEIPITQTTSLLFRDSYDNVHQNTALFTLRVYFGGINKVDDNDIAERLLDPIERHIGVLYTGSGIPSQQAFFDTGQGKLQVDNIWFFSPNGQGNVINANSCTFENPCNSTQFTPANVTTINGLAPNTNFYLAGGTNINYPKGPFTVNSGQSIYGRTSNFCQIAPYGLYPIVNGNLVLQGSNTIQAIMLFNDPVTAPGISITNASNIVIDRSQVGPSLTMSPFAVIPIGTFQNGIYMSNAQNVSITGSIINAGDSQTNTASNAQGIIAMGSSNITVQGSALNVRDSVVASTQNVSQAKSLAAIYLSNSNNVNVQTTVINMVADGLVTGPANLSLYVSGIYAKTAGNVTATGDIFNLNAAINSTGSGNNGSNGANGAPGTYDVPGGNGTAGGAGGTGGVAFSSVTGITATGTTAITMSNNILNLSATAISAAGGNGGLGGSGGAGYTGPPGHNTNGGNGGTGGTGGTGGYARSLAIGASAANSATITSSNDNFNLNAVANGGIGGAGGQAGAGGVGGSGTLNAAGAFGGNGSAGGNSGAGGAASSTAIGTNASGTAKITIQGDVFNLNAVANGGRGGSAGRGGAGGNGGNGGVGGTGGAGGVGGVGGTGGIGGATTSSTVGVSASGSATIVLNNVLLNLNTIATGGAGGAGGIGGAGGNGGTGNGVAGGAGGNGGNGGNGGAGGAATSSATGASATGSSGITVNGSTFNLNSSANSGAGGSGGSGGAAGNGGAGVPPGAAGTPGVAGAAGAAGVALASAIGASAAGGSTINLASNTFNLKACQNGLVGTRTPTVGNVILTGSNVFTLVPCP